MNGLKTDTIINRDALYALRERPEESVHCCVTSPPYYALRDYGLDMQIDDYPVFKVENVRKHTVIQLRRKDFKETNLSLIHILRWNKKRTVHCNGEHRGSKFALT